jgi:UDP-N-acetylglucosamine 2-epimerase (non-hydrolysing)
MKVLSVVGARPQFVKLAPMHRALISEDEHTILHTGQHYDSLLSESFFRELSIPEPTINLDVGSESHAVQTARILEAIEPAIMSVKPDCVLVYGDTNSTLAAAIAAVKLGVPVVHLESGLRSRNRHMPEEHNRVLTDHASDLCLAPSQEAMRNLVSEGLEEKSVFVGDVMLDILLDTLDQLGIKLSEDPGPSDAEYLSTIHRQENTDDPVRLEAVLSCLGGLDRPVKLLTHPRLKSKMVQANLKESSFPAIQFVPSLPYPELLAALASAPGLITDSGGLQKEAYFLKTRCVTLRNETEWPETVELGWNALLEPNPTQVVKFFELANPVTLDTKPYGDGNAAQLAVSAIRNWIGSRS